MRTLISIMALLLAYQSGAQKYAGPKCLGPFCIDRRTATSKLVRQLGSPAQRAAQYWCYEKDGCSALRMQTIDSEPDVVAEVFVSDFPNCRRLPKRVTTDDIYAWKTREGIGLGSSEADVLKAYGKPSSTGKVDTTNPRAIRLMVVGYRSGDNIPEIGDKMLSYHGDLSQDLSTAGFGIRDGKVCWIDLSMNE